MRVADPGPPYPHHRAPGVSRPPLFPAPLCQTTLGALPSPRPRQPPPPSRRADRRPSAPTPMPLTGTATPGAGPSAGAGMWSRGSRSQAWRRTFFHMAAARRCPRTSVGLPPRPPHLEPRPRTPSMRPRLERPPHQRTTPLPHAQKRETGGVGVPPPVSIFPPWGKFKKLNLSPRVARMGHGGKGHFPWGELARKIVVRSPVD